MSLLCAVIIGFTVGCAYRKQYPWALAAFSQLFNWRDDLAVVRPETMIRWLPAR